MTFFQLIIFISIVYFCVPLLRIIEKQVKDEFINK